MKPAKLTINKLMIQYKQKIQKNSKSDLARIETTTKKWVHLTPFMLSNSKNVVCDLNYYFYFETWFLLVFVVTKKKEIIITAKMTEKLKLFSQKLNENLKFIIYQPLMRARKVPWKLLSDILLPLTLREFLYTIWPCW